MPSPVFGSHDDATYCTVPRQAHVSFMQLYMSIKALASLIEYLDLVLPTWPL